jgi:hypothetical protein
MEEKKKKFNFGTKLYKPPTFGKKEMDEGLQKALSSERKTEIRPINISGQQRKTEISTFESKKKEEPEPYWTAEQWEEWAYQLYKNYPDTHEYLPDWFLEAMEEE